MTPVVRLCRHALAAAAFAVGLASAADAQRVGPERPPREARGAGGARGARLEELVQRRLGLSSAQVSQLRSTTRSNLPKRAALAQEERRLADSLRGELAAAQPDEPTIARHITRLFAVRRARLDLREREQRELAEFLSPSQRAMLLGLEEQAQRRAASVRGAARQQTP